MPLIYRVFFDILRNAQTHYESYKKKKEEIKKNLTFIISQSTWPSQMGIEDRKTSWRPWLETLNDCNLLEMMKGRYT